MRFVPFKLIVFFSVALGIASQESLLASDYIDALNVLNQLETGGNLTPLSPACKDLVQKPLGDPFELARLNTIDFSNENGTKGEWYGPIRAAIVRYIRGTARGFSYLAETMLADLTFRSKAIKTAFFRASILDDPKFPFDETFLTFPFVRIGGGVIDVIGENVFNKIFRALGGRKPLIGLTIQKGPTPGSNFGGLGDSGYLNSTTRQSLPEGENLPGKGNLNFLVDGIFQLSDLLGKYNTWKELAAIITMNRFFGSSPIIFETEVIKVYDLQIQNLPPELDGLRKKITAKSARYLVVIKDVNSSRMGYIFTDYIQNAVGLGTDDIPEAVAKESNPNPFKVVFKGVKSKTLKMIRTYSDLMEGAEKGTTVIGDYINKRIVVAGFGDSGKTAIEWLIGEAPKRVYQSGSRQEGSFEKIFWVLSDEQIQEVKSYLSLNRVRYTDIAEEIDAGRIVFVTGRVKRFSLRKTFFGEDFFGAEEIVTVVVKPDGTEESLLSERVIAATGYSADKIYDKIYGEMYDTYKRVASVADTASNTGAGRVLRSATGKLIAKVGDEGVGVGFRLFSNILTIASQIDVLGATKKLVEKDEQLKGVAVNFVSIFINAPLAAAYFRNFYDRVIRNVIFFSPNGRSSLYRDWGAELPEILKKYVLDTAESTKIIYSSAKSNSLYGQIAGSAPGGFRGIPSPAFAPNEEWRRNFFLKLSHHLYSSSAVLGFGDTMRDTVLRVYKGGGADGDRLNLSLDVGYVTKVLESNRVTNARAAFFGEMIQDAEFRSYLRILHEVLGDFEIAGINIKVRDVNRPEVDVTKFNLKSKKVFIE